LGKHRKGNRKRVENVKEMEERRKIKVRKIKIKRINGYIRGKMKAKRKYWCILGWISFEDRKGEDFGLKYRPQENI
jgi:hypothetical protein